MRRLFHHLPPGKICLPPPLGWRRVVWPIARYELRGIVGENSARLFHSIKIAPVITDCSNKTCSFDRSGHFGQANIQGNWLLYKKRNSACDQIPFDVTVRKGGMQI